METDEHILNLEHLIGPRQFFTPGQLVKMGIYGCKSSVWRAIHSGNIEAIKISDRRWVITKDSLLKHLLERQTRK
jgi:uncharacterized OsmC-like protein